MREHGYLAINAGDISVALFDCERMSRIWTLEDARRGRKNDLLARASSVPGLWGELAGSWNARDREYVRGDCGVLHYTALHRQPWYPFPKLFVYRPNPAADVWHDLEESANESGFRMFSAKRPSRGYKTLCHEAKNMPEPPQDPADGQAGTAESGDLARLLKECDVHTVVDCRIRAIGRHRPIRAAITADSGMTHIVAFDPATTEEKSATQGQLDAVVCTETLEYVPDEDIPWLLERLFSRARHLLYCIVHENSRNRRSSDPANFPRRSRSAAWWQYQFELVARHHPTVRWRLRAYEDRAGRRRQPLVLEGNECSDRDAVVWVLANQKPGHTSQATALAELLGWPCQVIRVEQRLMTLIRVMLRLNTGYLESLRPPWPDVIVACGWWPTRVARWIKKRSGGRARLLLAGRKCGPVKSPTDILVSCEHFHLPIHERRIQTLLPIHPITPSRLDAARQRGLQIMQDSPAPHVALLVGGSSKQHVLTSDAAGRLGREVLAQVQAAGGSLFAVTSRRTGDRAAAALTTSLQEAAQVHVWTQEETDNPYLSYLAAADILVVTGESESMLMDAIATGKPVYIYPLRQRRYGPWLTLGALLAAWSERRPKNRRGTERPQQGFEYLCSRILKREWILPPRDIDGLHRRLVEEGLAAMFGDSLSAKQPVPAPTDADLGRRLRIMLAQPPIDPTVRADDSLSLDMTAEA